MTDLAWTAAGRGPPVLLVMGLGMPGAAWRRQVDALVQHHRVVTFDHRGVGASPPLTDPWSMVEGARDALAVLDAAGHESAHIVGVSMGGMVVQELALRWPERVSTLSLVATSPGGGLHWVPPTRSWSLLVRSSRARTAEERHPILDELLFPPGTLADMPADDLAQRRLDVGGPPARATLRAQFGAVRRHDTRGRLERLQVPTLVVQPGRDRMVRPRRSEQLASRIPNARLVSMPDAGHGLIFHAADELNAALLGHFAEHE